MKWKTPPSTPGLYLVGFSSDPASQVFVSELPKHVTRARYVFGSNDMNELHHMSDEETDLSTPLGVLQRGEQIYRFHRSEILNDLVSHVYLEDIGDE